MQQDKQHNCHGGTVTYYSHDSAVTNCTMSCAVFMPPNAGEKTPYALFLSGLTCTPDNFTTKAGAFGKAAELGLALVMPDTSPRGENVADDESYDLGQGASFYLDATQEPWAQHFQMESYLMKEFLPMVEEQCGLDPERAAIFGHSMGGHGALTLYFKHPQKFNSCSAFSPVVAPVQVPWGEKAFTAYLGDDKSTWADHDACVLVERAENASGNAPILIDQGTADGFLEEQLKPHLFEEACNIAGQKLSLRMQDGYDHSYFFIQSFVDDHLEHHFKYL